MDLLLDIKLFVCDFDGIFTDGKLLVFSDGKTAKQIDYQDIMAVANIIKKDIKFAVISGEKSHAIDLLKEKFPMIDTFQNERKKLQVLESLIQKYNVKPQNIVYMGDDINDIACLELVGHPYTVQNAHKKVKEIKNIKITNKSGGQGAVREVADLIE